MASGKRNIHQRPKQLNPAAQQLQLERAIKIAHKKGYQSGIDWACIAYEVMTVMVLHDKFGIEDKDELKRYCHEMGSLADCMTREYATLSDFVKTLKEECGFTLDDDDLVRIDPGLAGLMEEKEATDKNS